MLTVPPAHSESEDEAIAMGDAHVTVVLHDMKVGSAGLDRRDKRRRSSLSREGNVKKHQPCSTNSIPSACIRLQYGELGVTPCHSRSPAPHSSSKSPLLPSTCNVSHHPSFNHLHSHKASVLTDWVNAAGHLQQPSAPPPCSLPQFSTRQPLSISNTQHVPSSSNMEEDSMDVDPRCSNHHTDPQAPSLATDGITRTVPLPSPQHSSPLPPSQHDQAWPHSEHSCPAVSMVQQHVGLDSMHDTDAHKAEEDMGHQEGPLTMHAHHVSHGSQGHAVQGAFGDRQQPPDQPLEGRAHPEDNTDLPGMLRKVGRAHTLAVVILSMSRSILLWTSVFQSLSGPTPRPD